MLMTLAFAQVPPTVLLVIPYLSHGSARASFLVRADELLDGRELTPSEAGELADCVTRIVFYASHGYEELDEFAAAAIRAYLKTTHQSLLAHSIVGRWVEKLHIGMEDTPAVATNAILESAPGMNPPGTDTNAWLENQVWQEYLSIPAMGFANKQPGSFYHELTCAGARRGVPYAVAMLFFYKAGFYTDPRSVGVISLQENTAKLSKLNQDALILAGTWAPTWNKSVDILIKAATDQVKLGLSMKPRQHTGRAW